MIPCNIRLRKVMRRLHPLFLTCSCYFSLFKLTRVCTYCVCLHCRWKAAPSPPVNSRPQQEGRISARPVNKTLLLLHNVGESAAVGPVWHLCRLITALRDHLSLRATRLSCRGPGDVSRGRTVSSEGRETPRSRPVHRCEASST